MEPMITKEYVSTTAAKAYAAASAVASWMQDNGYEATAHEGPIFDHESIANSGDDYVMVYTSSPLYYARVRASEAAWEAYYHRNVPQSHNSGNLEK